MKFKHTENLDMGFIYFTARRFKEKFGFPAEKIKMNSLTARAIGFTHYPYSSYDKINNLEIIINEKMPNLTFVISGQDELIIYGYTNMHAMNYWANME